jgi:hypothetical protein
LGPSVLFSISFVKKNSTQEKQRKDLPKAAILSSEKVKGLSKVDFGRYLRSAWGLGGGAFCY